MKLSLGNGFGCIYEVVEPRRCLWTSLALTLAWSQQSPWDRMERRGALSTIWFIFTEMLFNLRSWIANGTPETWGRLSATNVLQHPPFRPHVAAGWWYRCPDVWGPTSRFSQCNAQVVTSLGIPALSCLINVLPDCLIPVGLAVWLFRGR